MNKEAAQPLDRATDHRAGLRGYDPLALSSARLTNRTFRRIAATATLLASSALALPGAASALSVTPQSGGSLNADAISDLFKLILAVLVVVFLVVEIYLIRSLGRSRSGKRDGQTESSGRSSSEMKWALGATALVVLIAIATFIELPSINNKPAGPELKINVTGRQFIWRYTYGDTLNSPYAYTEMVVPSNTVIDLNIQSSDVVHSWWIPALGGKIQAVPGITNHAWFKAPTPSSSAGDVYSGQSATLSGRQFASMIARVRVVSPPAFKTWLADQKARIALANQQAIKNRQKLTSEGQIPDLTPPAN